MGGIVAGVTFVLVVCAAGGARADSQRRLAYDPEQPIPAGYHLEHRTRYGLAISGIALFAAAYVPTAAAAWYDSATARRSTSSPFSARCSRYPRDRATATQTMNTAVASDDFVTAFV